jgi:nucleotide-binding universal stress UspA family protein
MTKIIAGVEASDRSRDAVAFASALAEDTGARLLLASVYPAEAASRLETSPELDRRLREKTLTTIQGQLNALGGGDADIWALSGGSVATHLHRLAGQQDAALIVIGSSHRGEVGRAFAGSTAERLLHGSPCPVVVVPKGFADRGGGPVRSIVVGYDGGAEAEAALAAAVTAARSLSATVRVVGVLAPSTAAGGAQMAWGGFDLPPGEVERSARRSFEAAVAELPHDIAVESDFVVGFPVDELAARSEEADLMVLGSRGHGPVSAVLLGSVSGRLVRRAACPVVVIPRGARTHFGELFAARASARLT